MLYLRPQGRFGVLIRRAELQVETEHGGARGTRPPRLTIVRRAGCGARAESAEPRCSSPPRSCRRSYSLLEARLLTEVVATALALWGLGLLVGHAGRISLSHATFMGVGAYGMAILAGRFGVPPLVGALLAAVIGFCAGIALGLPALRIKGQYLAIVTLSLAVVFPSVLNRFAWFTGGEFGLDPSTCLASPAGCRSIYRRTEPSCGCT